MVTSYQVLEPSFLSNLSDLDLEVEETKFSNTYCDNAFLLFLSQMLSIKTFFEEKIAHLKSAKEMASFFIIENASLATTYPDFCTAYMMYMTRDVAAAPQTPQLGGARPTLGAQVSLKLLFGYVTIFSSADLFTTDLNCRKKLACDIISECNVILSRRI